MLSKSTHACYCYFEEPKAQKPPMKHVWTLLGHEFYQALPSDGRNMALLPICAGCKTKAPPD